jgi:hypothetical protein
MPYQANQGPSLVAYNLTASGYAYLMRLLQLGAIEGRLGAMDLHHDLKPVFDAMHAVLAGGTVEIKILHRGSPDIVNELRGLLEQTRRDGNEINEKAGYYLTAGA